jgi:hypothetical protein
MYYYELRDSKNLFHRCKHSELLSALSSGIHEIISGGKKMEPVGLVFSLSGNFLTLKPCHEEK